MRKFEIEEKLHKILKKLSKKDKLKYEIIWKKIKEIINISDVEHYKNLRAPLHEFKRVHIDKSFVLVFKYNKAKDEVRFYDFDHLDKIYVKKF
ncbi:MAG: addiction module toxin RelE [Nanoarchaeota archaeon]|nr:addiction module toxin RelE [Nanoarchaeota archaeon]